MQQAPQRRTREPADRVCDPSVLDAVDVDNVVHWQYPNAGRVDSHTATGNRARAYWQQWARVISAAVTREVIPHRRNRAHRVHIVIRDNLNITRGSVHSVSSR